VDEPKPSLEGRVAAALGNINGVSIALAYALVNNALALLLAFGVSLSQQESATLLAFVNSALVLMSYVAHNAAKHSHSVIPSPPISEASLHTNGDS
jgi:hypothetical protein